MSSVCRRDYHWKDFASDYDQWLDDARAIYDEELEYSPLIQAYFDLMPERMDWYDQGVFDNHRVFKDFQTSLRLRQKCFLHDFADKVEDNLDELLTYFDQLVGKHCKLLLVRVDLYYLFEHSPTIRQFDRDIKKLVNRIQNKTRCSRIRWAMLIGWSKVARAKVTTVICWLFIMVLTVIGMVIMDRKLVNYGETKLHKDMVTFIMAITVRIKNTMNH
jgi:hypothetical protein